CTAIFLAAAAGIFIKVRPPVNTVGSSGSSRTAAEASPKGEPAGAAGTTGSEEPDKAAEIIPDSASAAKKGGKQPFREPKTHSSQSANESAVKERIEPRSDPQQVPARPQKEEAVEVAGGAGKAPNAYPVLTDTEVRIQAISWNSDPARRIAVINSRICREGDHVNGYKIIAINPDDIVVKAGGSAGKVPF
ncbi:MAG: general secretion pathway protein GspB, partial [Desulfosalsimonadaceae bacterium]